MTLRVTTSVLALACAAALLPAASATAAPASPPPAPHPGIDAPAFTSTPELGTVRELLALGPAPLQKRIDALPAPRRAALQGELARRAANVGADVHTPTHAPGTTAATSGTATRTDSPALPELPDPTHPRAVAYAMMGFTDAGVTLRQFVTFRALRADTVPSLDWTDDSCSLPAALSENIRVAREYSARFHEPCLRHDFGYRNFGSRGRNRFDPSAAMRERIDKRFLNDMLTEKSVTAGDRAAANVFFTGVRLFGAPSF